jgi:outer membrane protein assembly factor BamA
MKVKHLIYGVFVTIACALSACSTTKNLAEGEILYTGVKRMEIVHEDKTDAGITALEEVEAALSYPPNGAILESNSLKWPIPTGLWAYNSFVKYQEKKGLGHWMFMKFATNPVYLSTVNAATRVRVATNLLHDYGFFNGQVTYTVDSCRNPRKAAISYRIDMADPYFIDSVAFPGYPQKVSKIIEKNRSKSLLKTGENFNVLTLEAERERVSELLRNNGYYNFRSDFITFRADTLQRPGWVNLQVVPVKGLPAETYIPYYMGKTRVTLIGYNSEMPTDSMEVNGITLRYYGDKPAIRPNVLQRRFRMREGRLYSQRRLTRTQDALSQLGIFKMTDFSFSPRDTTAMCDTLDLNVVAVFDKPYDGELEFNVTTKSTDQTGPGAVFNLTRYNFLRTASKLSFQVKGSYEWQTNSTGVTGNKSKMNSYELGASLSLEVPNLLLPGESKRDDRRNYNSSTTLKLYADQLNRARFFSMLSFGGQLTYDFRNSKLWKHSVTPFRLTFNTLQSTTAQFDSITAVNRSLALSLGNQFIPAMSYTLTYNNLNYGPRTQVWWENTVTESGNITSLIYAAAGQSLSKTDKKLLNSPYAQFLKLTSEVRTLYNIGAKSAIAARLMGGILYSYGNQTVAPYSEQFYIGGANSIRAFTVRSLGPGSFHPDADNNYGYIDQTGDIKLEANVEYRFPLLGDLYGATFLDAGNVWLIRKDEQRPGGQLTLKDFGKTIALGTGFGIRYDLTFLVVRLDLGIALHAPYDTGKSGYYNIPKFKDGLGLHFAIGYPF